MVKFRKFENKNGRLKTFYIFRKHPSDQMEKQLHLVISHQRETFTRLFGGLFQVQEGKQKALKLTVRCFIKLTDWFS